MCFGGGGGGGTPNDFFGNPPPETLQQSAPVVKQTEAKSINATNSKSIADAATGGGFKDGSRAVADTKTNPLAIGTKKYRTGSGLNTSGLTISQAPSGIKV